MTLLASNLEKKSMLKASRREIPALVWRIQTQLTENSLTAKRHLHSNNVATRRFLSTRSVVKVMGSRNCKVVVKVNVKVKVVNSLLLLIDSALCASCCREHIC